jgi:hypothetical protein
MPAYNETYKSGRVASGSRIPNRSAGAVGASRTRPGTLVFAPGSIRAEAAWHCVETCGPAFSLLAVWNSLF